MSIHKLVTVTSIRFARNSRRHYRQHGRRDTRNYSFRFVELTLSSFFPFSTLPFQERIHPLVWHRMLIRSYISIIPPSFFYSEWNSRSKIRNRLLDRSETSLKPTSRAFVVVTSLLLLRKLSLGSSGRAVW